MSAARLHQHNQLPSDQFLDWFANAGYPMLEKKLRLGNLEYFNFSSFFTQADGRTVASFGSALDRKSAALKCAGEAMERQAMARFFTNRKSKISPAFWNSNGWAVHTSFAVAKEKALDEATERHLHLKSYLKHGWAGFNFVQRIDAGEIELKLFTARYTANQKVAGLVAAKSKRWPGVSFGYCLGNAQDIGSATFWQSAIFEAADKFLLLEEKGPGDTDDKNWLRRSISEFMNSDFDLNAMGELQEAEVESDLGDVEIHELDLSQELQLDFPLCTAFVHGGDLIPLFWKSELREDGEQALWPILKRHGITAIPEVHPVL